MSPEPIRYDSAGIDLHSRFQHTDTVAASPQDNTETVIATLTLADFGNLTVVQGFQLVGFAAFTVGTSGVSAQLQIKQTDTSGTAISDTGAVTETAADLDVLSCEGFDAGAGVGVYVLTLTVASGAAESAVSACSLRAIAI